VSTGWDLEQQRTYLVGLSAGIEQDIRATLDPSFAIEWLLDGDGQWVYRCFDSECWFAKAADVPPPHSDVERQQQIERIVDNVAYNMWPDEWTEPWPRCPLHHDHPLNPDMRHDRVSWVCPRDTRISVPVGELAATE
jgi:hypothetical protein